VKPIDQTKFGRPDGNCWVACVASILEVSIGELGDLEDAHRQTLIEWENGNGFKWSLILAETHALGFTVAWIGMNNPELPRLPPRGYSIANGPAPRGLPHSCVALDGVVVHDPHPDREKLVRIDSYDVLLSVVPEEDCQAQKYRRKTDHPHELH
jgi:hypothetical protein